MIGYNGIKMNWLNRQFLKWFTVPSNGIYITKDVTNIGVILISHDYYDHLEYDVIGYLYKKKKKTKE